MRSKALTHIRGPQQWIYFVRVPVQVFLASFFFARVFAIPYYLGDGVERSEWRFFDKKE